MGGSANFNQEEIIDISREKIQELKESCLETNSKSTRICLHNSVEDNLHEMLIVLPRHLYVRPHRHIGKSESFHIIEGELDVFIFDNDGNVVRRIQMGDYQSKQPFCYRLSSASYHTVLPKTKFAVFHEVTKGPFIRSETIYSPWSPSIHQVVEVGKFVERLRNYNP